jgi:hypothetical protein
MKIHVLGKQNIHQGEGDAVLKKLKYKIVKSQ